MTWSTPKVEINFKSSLAGSDNWIDVTADIVSAISINRGRQSELDHYNAGTCSFSLINRDRKYDFSNTAGTYYGLLLPRLQCRITCTFSAVTYPLYFGYIQGWPQSYDNEAQMATVQINCVDLFDILGQKVWSGNAGSAYHRLLRPTAWYKLSDELDPSIAMDSRGQSSMSFSGGAMSTSDDGGPTPSAGVEKVAKFDGYGYAKVTEATIPSQTDWTIGFWVRVRPPNYASEGTTKDYMILAYGDSIQIFCNIQTGPGFDTFGRIEVTLHRYTAPVIAFSMFGPNIADDKWHHIVISNASSLSKLFVDGKLITSATNLGANALDRLSPITLGDLPGDSGTQAFVGWVYDLFAYQSTLSDVAIDALYQASIDWPNQNTGERIQDMLFVFGLSTIPQSISTGYGRVSVGKDYSGSLLETMQDVADAEGGQIYMEADGTFIFRNRYDILTRTTSKFVQATFSDSPAANVKYLEASPTLDLQFLYNQATFSREDGPVYQVEDTASIAAYEVRGYDKTGLPLVNDNDAISAAEWIVIRYGQPLTRLPYVKFSPRVNALAMTEALVLTLQDFITVRRAPQNVGTAWQYNVHIEGISMSIDIVNMTWEVTYNLTQFGFVSGYLQIGSASFHLDNGKLGW